MREQLPAQGTQQMRAAILAPMHQKWPGSSINRGCFDLSVATESTKSKIPAAFKHRSRELAAPWHLPKAMWWQVHPGDTPGIPGEILAAGRVGPRQAWGLRSKHTMASWDWLWWREMGRRARSPSWECPQGSVLAPSPLPPTRGNRGLPAAPAGVAAVCGCDRSPCCQLFSTLGCASVSLSAKDALGNLPPSRGRCEKVAGASGRWWWSLGSGTSPAF